MEEMLQITRFEENPQIGGRLFSPSVWGLLEPMMMNWLGNAHSRGTACLWRMHQCCEMRLFESWCFCFDFATCWIPQSGWAPGNGPRLLAWGWREGEPGIF